MAATRRRTAAATLCSSSSRKCASCSSVEIATLVGRYYAMDRDNRWERIELAYRALVHGEAEARTGDPVAALQRSYEQDVTDEFIKPIVVTKGEGSSAQPVGLIRDDDAVIFFNFRADRARQMTYAPRRSRTSTNSPTPSAQKISSTWA